MLGCELPLNLNGKCVIFTVDVAIKIKRTHTQTQTPRTMKQCDSSRRGERGRERLLETFVVLSLNIWPVVKVFAVADAVTAIASYKHLRQQHTQ